MYDHVDLKLIDWPISYVVSANAEKSLCLMISLLSKGYVYIIKSSEDGINICDWFFFLSFPFFLFIFVGYAE